jgi:hypothetical protein
LESLPAVAAAARSGNLSAEQLGAVVKFADESSVCTAAGHHQMLVPNGPWALVGNPNRPDGLELVHVDQLNAEQASQLGLPPRRAGPHAA